MLSLIKNKYLIYSPCLHSPTKEPSCPTLPIYSQTSELPSLSLICSQNIIVWKSSSDPRITTASVLNSQTQLIYKHVIIECALH